MPDDFTRQRETPWQWRGNIQRSILLHREPTSDQIVHLQSWIPWCKSNQTQNRTANALLRWYDCRFQRAVLLCRHQLAPVKKEQIVTFINNNPLISDFLIQNNQPSQESYALKINIWITASQFPFRILQIFPPPFKWLKTVSSTFQDLDFDGS